MDRRAIILVGMLSDWLTKTMTSGRLNETLSTGIFDMRLTEESVANQGIKQRRASRKEQEWSQDS